LEIGQLKERQDKGNFPRNGSI